MNFYNFNTLRKTTIQFLDVFNDINVAKYKKNGDILKYVTVPIKFAPKEKFYYWLYERRHEIRLPMLNAYITGIEPSTNERGKNKEIKILTGDDSFYYKNLIPCTINYQLSIAVQYQNELDQILEQIIPYFNPYVMTRVNIPELDNYFDCKIILTGTSGDESTEIPENDYRVINWSLDFTVHSYVIKPLRDASIIEKMFMFLKKKDNNNIYESVNISGYKDNSGEIISDYEIIKG